MQKPEQGVGTRFPPVPAVIFPNWREMLNQASLSGPARGGYELAISTYLEYCRLNAVSVTLESARGFMADAERRKLARNPHLWKNALNWFFKRGHHTTNLPGAPSIGRADTGQADWERRLIERLRLNHYSWRTEQTYREWSWRLAQFMGKQDLEDARTLKTSSPRLRLKAE